MKEHNGDFVESTMLYCPSKGQRHMLKQMMNIVHNGETKMLTQQTPNAPENTHSSVTATSQGLEDKRKR